MYYNWFLTLDNNYFTPVNRLWIVSVGSLPPSLSLPWAFTLWLADQSEINWENIGINLGWVWMSVNKMLYFDDPYPTNIINGFLCLTLSIVRMNSIISISFLNMYVHIWKVVLSCLCFILFSKNNFCSPTWNGILQRL